MALIGPGGIGKTSIALTVLHHDRIRERFGDNRRFIRCDQFPASRAHFLSRLSKAVGSGAENPEDLIPLRPLLSSGRMILFLDNAESVLDPRGTNAQEIYAVVEELGQFGNICLCITSRVSTVPPDCKRVEIPTLSLDAACHTFYRIYDSHGPSNQVDNILEQLDFHPLSITLLATVAHHSKWGIDRLTKEWEAQRTGMLHTQHNKSLAATIELSLTSPMFQELGPDARDLLGVVAFFPQGVDENNLDWLFPNIPDRTNVFDIFCILSLTYRSNGFIRMLAPLRDHLSPKDPISSPVLRATKDYYFRRLSIDVYPGKPGYEEARWITSEDVNVEHLLDVFTSADPNSVDIWAACGNFMEHLFWHKSRLVVLGQKIEGLPDHHPSKPQCLFQLSSLFSSVGNYVEQKRLLVHTLKIWRERGNDLQVALTLLLLAEPNRAADLWEEGVEQVKEAFEIFKRLGHTTGQADSLRFLASLLENGNQPNAAEEAALQAIDLLREKDEQFRLCVCHRALGTIYLSSGKTEEAINHLETALEIASSFNWHSQLFSIHYTLATQFLNEGRPDDAHTHLGYAKSHTADRPYNLALAMELQALVWYAQGRLNEAESEALRCADVYEKLGATKDVEDCRAILRGIEKKRKSRSAPGEPLEMVLLLTPINSPFLGVHVRRNLASILRRILLRPTDPTSGQAPDS